MYYNKARSPRVWLITVEIIQEIRCAVISHSVLTILSPPKLWILSCWNVLYEKRVLQLMIPMALELSSPLPLLGTTHARHTSELSHDHFRYELEVKTSSWMSYRTQSRLWAFTFSFDPHTLLNSSRTLEEKAHKARKISRSVIVLRCYGNPSTSWTRQEQGKKISPSFIHKTDTPLPQPQSPSSLYYSRFYASTVFSLVVITIRSNGA